MFFFVRKTYGKDREKGTARGNGSFGEHVLKSAVLDLPIALLLLFI